MEEGMWIDVKEEQEWKMYWSISFIDGDRWMVESEEQSRNADSPISWMEEGRYMDVSEVHPLNVYRSIFVSEEGILIARREWHTKKAPIPILVIEDGKWIDDRDVQPQKHRSPNRFRDDDGTQMHDSFSQP